MKKYYNKNQIRDVLFSYQRGSSSYRKETFILKKFLKWFSILAVAGTAIGLVIAYFCKSSADTGDGDGSEFTEDEDFDLDADLKPASDRDYVSLNKNGEDGSDNEE